MARERLSMKLDSRTADKTGRLLFLLLMFTKKWSE